MVKSEGRRKEEEDARGKKGENSSLLHLPSYLLEIVISIVCALIVAAIVIPLHLIFAPIAARGNHENFGKSDRPDRYPKETEIH